MNQGLYLSAASMRLNQFRHATVANNLANVQTTSFKRDLMLIAARPTPPAELGIPPFLAAPVLDGLGGGLLGGGTFTDFAQGPLDRTDGNYDLALSGKGFFTVEAGGQKRYTRDGRLTRDQEGYLATVADGLRLLDSAGKPIPLPPGEISVDSFGTIHAGGATAKLNLVTFDDPAALAKAGDNTFVLRAPAEEKPSTAAVRQGYLESSGQDPVAGLVEMIDAQRAYDASARMVRFADAMMGKAVNEIARIG